MNISHLSDKDLVTRILSGHPDLFGALVERHIRAAHAIAYARLGNTTDAEDAVQEAFLRAYEKLATLRDPARFAAWLLTIARHEASRVAAKRFRNQHTDIDLTAQYPESSFSESSDPEDISALQAAHPDPAQHEMNAILRDHVMRLPEPAREVLLLHYFAGHSARDIAALLDLRRAAVLKRLQRAREQLAETMLRDLKTARPSEASLSKQIVRIAALTTALALPALTVSQASGAVAGYAARVYKFISVAAGIVIAASISIGVSIWLNSVSYTRVITAEQPAATEVVVDAATRTNADRQDFTQRSLQKSAHVETMARNTDPAANDLEQLLLQSVSVKFGKQHLASALDQLAKTTGVYILIDRRAVGLPLGPPSVSHTSKSSVPYPIDAMLAEVNIHDQPPDIALGLVASELGLRAVQEPGFIWISTPERIRQEVHTEPYRRFAGYAKIREPRGNVTLEFSNVHLQEIVDAINKQYPDFGILLDYRVMDPLDRPNRMTALRPGKATDEWIRLQSSSSIHLRDFLKFVCRLTNTTPVAQRDYVWISSPYQLRKDGLADVPPAERAEFDRRMAMYVGGGLRAHVSHGGYGSIADILGDMSNSWSVNFVVDQRVVQRDSEPTGSTLVAGDDLSTLVGAPSHGMLFGFNGKDISLRSVLDILARQLDLTYKVWGPGILFTSQTALNLGEPAPADLLSAHAFADLARPGNDVQLLEIQDSGQKQYTAIIVYDEVATAYKVGDEFGRYRVLEINLISNTVDLLTMSERRRFTIRPETPPPRRHSAD